MNSTDFVIDAKEYTKKGLFIRFPIQKVEAGTYDEDKYSYYSLMDIMKHPFSSPYNFCIRILNIKQFKRAQKWEQPDPGETGEFAGCFFLISISPFYRIREIRELTAYPKIEGSNIKYIHSSGYVTSLSKCGGECNIENTKIVMKDRVVKIKEHEKFRYTYSHIVARLLNGESV